MFPIWWPQLKNMVAVLARCCGVYSLIDWQVSICSKISKYVLKKKLVLAWKGMCAKAKRRANVNSFFKLTRPIYLKLSRNDAAVVARFRLKYGPDKVSLRKRGLLIRFK